MSYREFLYLCEQNRVRLRGLQVDYISPVNNLGVLRGCADKLRDCYNIIEVKP